MGAGRVCFGCLFMFVAFWGLGWRVANSAELEFLNF